MEEREVCWFLTLRCNQNCRYCHRFLGIKELDLEDNKKVLDKIAENGIKKITFTGGEALLHPNFLELLKMAYEKGIKCKLITNGTLLAKNPNLREIFSYLDSIALSIDSVDNEINEKLGRGYNHTQEIATVLESLRNVNLKVNINTIVSRVNLESAEELGFFLQNYRIDNWRVFKFMPLRENAKLNEKEFEISKVEFKVTKGMFLCNPNMINVEFREELDMERKYLLIMPNGDITITENGKDVTIGNILKDNVKALLAKRPPVKKQPKKCSEKITAFVAYNEGEDRKNILEAIKKLDYVDVVGVSANGIETYNKIVDLQPEMVFLKYDLEGMNGLEIVKKLKEKLNTKIPIFNIIGNNIPENKFDEIMDIGGMKINTLVRIPNKERIIWILEDYKEFKET